MCGKYGFSSVYPEDADVQRVMDNKKVSDHHAIIPTAEVGEADLQELSKGERDILMLVGVRLLCATATDHRFLETEITVSCAGEQFRAKGKTILEEGWKAVEAAFRSRSGEKQKDGREEHTLPPVKEGQVFSHVKACLGRNIRSQCCFGSSPGILPSHPSHPFPGARSPYFLMDKMG